MNLRQMLEVILRRKQALAAAVPTDQPMIRVYVCAMCLRLHREGIDPEFANHIRLRATAPRERVATPNEVLQRFRLEPAAKGGAA